MQHLLKNQISSVQTTPRVRISSEFARLSPPVIIIGMHRSGTSMVAGMLHTMGVFVDPMLDSEVPSASLPSDTARTAGYGESVAFRLVNEALLGRAGANWCSIEPFMARRDHPRFSQLCVGQLAAETHGSLLTGYLTKNSSGSPEMWGWKDPRNSLTLPYWLQLFPGAKLLHVRRNSDDIIRSLQRREAANAAAARNSSVTRSRIVTAAANPGVTIRSIGRRLGLAAPAPKTPQTHEQWLELANAYTQACACYSRHTGGYLEVSYEDIVRDPINNAGRIADFISPDISLNHVLKAASFVSVSRS